MILRARVSDVRCCCVLMKSLTRMPSTSHDCSAQSCPGIVSEYNENRYMALCEYTGINLQFSLQAAHFSVEGIYRNGSLRDKLLYHCPVNVGVVAAGVDIAKFHCAM